MQFLKEAKMEKSFTVHYNGRSKYENHIILDQSGINKDGKYFTVLYSCRKHSNVDYNGRKPSNVHYSGLKHVTGHYSGRKHFIVHYSGRNKDRRYMINGPPLRPINHQFLFLLLAVVSRYAEK